MVDNLDKSRDAVPMQSPSSDSPAGEAKNAKVHFEPTDISLRGVLIVVVVAGLLMPLHQFCMMMFFQHEERSERVGHPAELPRTMDENGVLPVEPRLEQLDRLAGIATPDDGRQQMLAEATLNSYGSTQDKEFVHVPIHWAMEQVVSRLPVNVSKSHGPVSNRGLLDAGEPNSGRMFRGR